MDKVPVFHYFDVYKNYNNEPIEDYTYYVIEILEETEQSKILFESKFARTYGFVLNNSIEKYKIHYYRKPLKIVNVNFKNAITELFNNKTLSTDLKKIIANKITGVLEIHKNKKFITKFFEDYNEAENYRIAMNGRIIPLMTYSSVETFEDYGLDMNPTPEAEKIYMHCVDEIHGYLVNVGSQKDQIEGFKPIKDIIYLRQKLKMYNLYNKLV